jgi:thiol-activated cytolysin
MKNVSIVTIIGIMGILILIAGCDSIIDPDKVMDVDASIRSMGYIEQEAPHDPEVSFVELDDPDRPPDIPGYYCTVYKHNVAMGFNSNICLDPTTDVIWPGSLIDGDTVRSGEYRPIAAERGPLTLSISISNMTGDVSRTIPEAKLSTVRQVIRDIVTQELLGSTVANVSFEIENVYSEDQLRIAVGAHFDGFGHKLDGMFNFNNQLIRTRTLVKFMQVYYTLDIDIPPDPAGFFAPGVSWDDIVYQLSGYTSPVYVSTITYGRMALFSVESSASSEEINMALQYAYNGFGVHAGTEIEVQCKDILNTSLIKALIIGGSGAKAVKAVNGFEGLKEWITTGGSFSNTSPGAPLSYKLRYLKDNSIANIVLSSEYYVRNCVKINNKFRVNVLDFRILQADIPGIIIAVFKNKAKIILYSGYTGEGNLSKDTLKEISYILKKDEKVNINRGMNYTFDPSKLEDAFITVRIESVSPLMEPFDITTQRKLSISEVCKNCDHPGDDPTGKYYVNIDNGNIKARLSFIVEPVE